MLRKIFKLIKRNILAFALGAIIFGTTGIMAATQLASTSVYYDNSTSGGSSNTVSGALDELYEKAKSCSSGNCPEGKICIPGPIAFESDSWETINYAVQSGNVPYKVGDTRTVDMGSLGTHTLRVANTSACANGKTSKTACGFVVEFADIITTDKMNSSNTNEGGWPASILRNYINNTIYKALPSDLQSVIADTTVVSSHGYSESTNFTSTDKLYLLAPKEIYSDWSNSYDTAKDTTRQLDYYKNQGVTTTSNYSRAIKQYNGSNTVWWLRSADSNYGMYDFFHVNTEGYWYHNSAYNTYGVAPAFRIA